MDISFYVFFVSIIAVIIISALMVLFSKKSNEKNFKNAFVSPSNNCEMNADRYSGKYRVYKKTEVSDGKF